MKVSLWIGLIPASSLQARASDAAGVTGSVLGGVPYFGPNSQVIRMSE